MLLLKKLLLVAALVVGLVPPVLAAPVHQSNIPRVYQGQRSPSVFQHRGGRMGWHGERGWQRHHLNRGWQRGHWDRSFHLHRPLHRRYGHGWTAIHPAWCAINPFDWRCYRRHRHHHRRYH